MIMNKFEFEFINDLQDLELTRIKVCKELKCTLPTLKSKLKNPDSLTIKDIKILKNLKFNLKTLKI